MPHPIYLRPPLIIPVFLAIAAIWLLTAINSVAQLFAAPLWFEWLPRAALLLACPIAAWLLNRTFFAQQTTWRYQPHSQTFERCQWQRTRWQVQHTLAKHHIAGIAAEQIYQNGIPLTARIWLETTHPSTDPSRYTLATFRYDRETGFQAMQQAQQRIANQTQLPLIPCVLRQQADLSEQPARPEQFQAAVAPSNPLWVFVLHLIWAGIVISAGIAAIRYAPQFANEKWAIYTAWAVASILLLYALSGCLQSYARWRNHRKQSQQPSPSAPSIPPRNLAARRSIQTAYFSRKLWLAACIISASLALLFSLSSLPAALMMFIVAGSILFTIWQTAPTARQFRYHANSDTFEWQTLDPSLRWQTQATAPAQDFIGILREHDQIWLIGAAGKPNQFVSNQNSAHLAAQLAQATGLPLIARKKAA